jgi:hypothetical protein
MKVTIEYKENLREWRLQVVQNGRLVCDTYYTTFGQCITRAQQF